MPKMVSSFVHTMTGVAAHLAESQSRVQTPDRHRQVHFQTSYPAPRRLPPLRSHLFGQFLCKCLLFFLGRFTVGSPIRGISGAEQVEIAVRCLRVEEEEVLRLDEASC